MIGNNIKSLRKHLKMTQAHFAETIGIRGPSLSAIETEDSTATNRLLTTICAVHNVNREWLETGKGPMFKDAGGGLDRFSPAHRLLIKRFTGYFAEKVPIAETEKTIEVVHGLIDILMSDREEAKKAIQSSILALKQTLPVCEDDKQPGGMKEDIKKPKSKLNPKPHTKKTRTG